MNAVIKVLIGGDDMGGLCVATASRRQHIEVDPVEPRAQWTVCGVDSIQQRNVVPAMPYLSGLDGHLGAAFAFMDMTLTTAAGEQLARISGQYLAAPKHPASVGISRPARHQVLMASGHGRRKFIRESTMLAGDRNMVHDCRFDRIGVVRRLLKVAAEPA